MNTPSNDLSMARAATMAGIAYLIMILIAPFSYGYVYTGLIVPGDAASSIANVRDNYMLFRAGIMGFVIVILADVVVAIGLYRFLSPVNQSLALLMAWLRLIYVAIFAVALNSLFDVLFLVSDGIKYFDVTKTGVAETELLKLIHHFDYAWLIGLVFFAGHLFLVGTLIAKADYIPSLLGVLVAFAALGYLTDSFARFLLPDSDAYRETFVLTALTAAAIGELSLCLWLLFKGEAAAEQHKHNLSGHTETNRDKPFD